MVVGYRGGNDVFLAMQRGEIQVHSTSITTFRGRNAAFVKSGEGIGIAYLVPVDAGGGYETSKFITEMPAFPDLYKQVHGKMPSGDMWDALNWLTNQTGELTFVGLAPPATNAELVGILRKAYEAASNDPGFHQGIRPSATACPTPISTWSAAAACSARSPTCSRACSRRCARRSAGRTDVRR